MRDLFLAGLAVLGLGALTAVSSGGGRRALQLAGLLVATGCGLAAAGGVTILAGASPWEVALPSRLPGGLIFGLDALSAFFVVVIALVGAAAAMFGIGYFAHERRRGSAGAAHGGVALLVVALLLVVAARSAVAFLLAWEAMAVLAFALVMFDHEHAATRRAGFVYLAATHTATLALIALVVVWGGAGDDLSFRALAARALVGGFPRTAVLLLALLGFGLKAGIVPLHFWLPEAHAAAPSHVSALMSGLVIKMGIYGLLRVLVLAGGAPPWFGWTILALGLVSGVLGVVWALAQHDLKRLLAYHSVENIGIILIGIGAGILGAANGMPVVSALGYTGALLHVLNHAVFKGLLFLGAGSIVHATGTRRIDALGGLARRIPVTAAVFLVASAAIVGLPPLNGFISEWTIVRALASGASGPGEVRIVIFALAGLGLIGGLALACFAKVNGVMFLGQPRENTGSGREGGPLLLAPMLALAAVCIVIGVVPAVGLLPAGAAAAQLSPMTAETLRAGVLAGTRTLTGLMASLAALLVLAALLPTWWSRRTRVTRDTWSCGYPELTPRMQYTAASFAAPVLEPFGRVTGVRAERDEHAFVTHGRDPVLDGGLAPAWTRVRGAGGMLASAWTRALHVALLWVLATVLALVVYLALSRMS